MTKEEFQTKLKEIIDTKGKEWLSVGGTIEKIDISMAELKSLYNAKNSKEVFNQIPFIEIDDQGNQIRLKTEDNFIDVRLAQTTSQTSSPDSAKTDLGSILSSLNNGIYEKDEAMRLCLLAVLAGESVFMLGLPGTAKSMISRKICNAFSGKEKYFEYLMSQFSTPDEIFGPVSLKALENDEYKRIVDGFLPTAEVAFLDEIWKAGPAIQNTLLTILNEKKFHNGKEVLNVPLKAFFAASNELPAKNCGLEALFDRFLIRTVVNPIKDEENFNALFVGQCNENEAKGTININDYQRGGKYFEKIESVVIPENILQVIHSIRQEIQVQNNKLKAENEKSETKEELFYVSDRRWKKIAHLLKTSAFANRRKQIDLMDLQLITYCIWSTEKQKQLAEEIVLKCIEQNGLEYSANIDEIEEEIETFERTIRERFYKCQKAGRIVTEHEGKKYIKINWDNKAHWISDEDIWSDDFTATKKVYNFKDNGNAVSWCTESESYYWNSRTYQKNAEIIIQKRDSYSKKSEVFNSSVIYSPLEKESNIAYDKIKKSINTELNNLLDFENRNGNTFKQNLFADQKCYNVIMSKLSDEKSKLENEQIKLEKVKSLYAK